jgi:hypothetical protein
MDGTADDRYFEWLYSLIGSVNQKNRRRNYWSLARQLYVKRFRVVVRRDVNRAEDGICLRDEFVERWGHEGIDPGWMDLDCSLLEMLIALSAHLAFESYGETGDWFWKLMENLELQRYSDNVYNATIADDIDDVIERVLDRAYGPDGVGGLFPLRDADRDQRRVEIWYQKEAYLLEGLRVNNGPRV